MFLGGLWEELWAPREEIWEELWDVFLESLAALGSSGGGVHQSALSSLSGKPQNSEKMKI